MKKQLLWVALTMMAMLFVGCRKDDIDPSKPFRVQGSIDPGFSLPVIGSGQLNLNDLLSSFDGTFSGMILDDEVITFHYDTSLSQTIDISSKSVKKANRFRLWTKDDPDSLIHLVDTNISYEIPIDLFDKTQDIDVQIAELLMNLKVYVRGECPDEETANFLRQNASISLNRLKVQYVPQGSTSLTDFDGNAALSDSLVIHDIVAGDSVTFYNVNLASIINSRPEKIVASFHMNFNVSTSLYDTIVNDIIAHGGDMSQLEHFQEMLEKVQMAKLRYDANLNIDLPFEISIGQMEYEYRIDVSQVASNGDSSMSIKEMVDKIKDNLNKFGVDFLLDTLNRFIFEFENGIPLNIRLNADFVDDNDNVLSHLFTNGVIASAVTSPVTGKPGVSEASAPSFSRINVPLDLNNLEGLFNSTKLKLTLGLSTNGTDKNSIKRSNYLKLKVKLQLHPKLQLDIPLFDNNGNSSNN